MSSSKNLIICSLLAASLFTSCSDDDSDSKARSAATASFPADVAVAWMDLLHDSIRDASLSPPVASRAMAYCGVAFYEAVVPGMPDHQSLGGQLNDLGTLPEVGSGVHYWPAVANTAMAAAMRDLFSAAPAVVTAVDALESQLEAGFAMKVSQPVLDRSTTHGTALATAVLAWAATDGYTTWHNCGYTPPLGEGLWEPTPPAFAAALEPCWGRMRTFALAYGAECPCLPPTVFSEDPGSKFQIEAAEVQTAVDNLTLEQTEIAQFWADNPGQTATPPGHWVSILSQVCTQQALTLDVAAEGLCRVGLATADAFISCWDMKFYFNLVRPITYIQSPTGLNDPTWNTAPAIGGGGNIPTPPFPEHTSGHSVQSGAAAEVLTDLLGALPFVDDTHASLGLAPRSFDSFHEAADEAAISRLYAGIHFRPSIERGVEQGICIGNVINTQIRFRK